MLFYTYTYIMVYQWCTIISYRHSFGARSQKKHTAKSSTPAVWSVASHPPRLRCTLKGQEEWQFVNVCLEHVNSSSLKLHVLICKKWIAIEYLLLCFGSVEHLFWKRQCATSLERPQGSSINDNPKNSHQTAGSDSGFYVKSLLFVMDQEPKF